MTPAPTGPLPPSGTRRRAVLAGLAGGAVLAGGAWWATRDTDVLASVTSAGGEPGTGAPSVLPRPVVVATLPEGVESGVPGVVPFRVPIEDFFQVDTAFGLPKVDAGQWRLRIHGMVERELTLDYADVLGREMLERDITLACVSNEVGGDSIGNAVWLGTRIAPVLAEAGPDPQADMVLSTSHDGWTASTPLETLTDDRDAILAVGMNGEVLPRKHGFPVRMVVPGLYGYVSATKWLVDLKVTRFDRDEAYWTEGGWSPRGPVKLSSRIDVPRDGATVAPGPVAVGGVAWGPSTGIEAVEVSVDGGTWQPARLAASGGLDAWRQWSLVWTATAGRHELRVRTADSAGQVQTGERGGVLPDGPTGWHTIQVVVA